jgi:hypothetical protein
VTKKQIPISGAAPNGGALPEDEPTPLAFTVEPSSGPVHTPLVLTGPGFGDQLGRLTLNEVPMPALVWGDLAIQTLVPYGATSGELMVITADGRRASVPFTVEDA